MIKKGSTVFYLVMIALFMYILFYFKDSDHFIGALAFILSVTCFYLADKLFKLKFKSYHYAILIFMATVGVLLSPIYFIFAAYDKILHFSFPFLGCFLVFYLVNKLDMDFKTKVFFTFTIMITLITFEEIVEFLLDWFFDLKLQGVYLGARGLMMQVDESKIRMVLDRITDTMFDLILGVCGATLFVLIKIIPLRKTKNKK
jgi:hypothetical protein